MPYFVTTPLGYSQPNMVPAEKWHQVWWKLRHARLEFDKAACPVLRSIRRQKVSHRKPKLQSSKLTIYLDLAKILLMNFGDEWNFIVGNFLKKKSLWLATVCGLCRGLHKSRFACRNAHRNARAKVAQNRARTPFAAECKVLFVFLLKILTLSRSDWI